MSGNEAVEPTSGMVVLFGPSPPQHHTMARLGQLRWAELQLFAVTGAWVVDHPEPPVASVLATCSHHAAWRARQLLDRLPDAGHLRASEVTLPPTPEHAELVEGVAAIGPGPDRLWALATVWLEPLADAVGAAGVGLSPVADGPTMRTLDMLGRDLRRDAVAVAQLADQLGDEVQAGGPQGGGVQELATRLRVVGGW